MRLDPVLWTALLAIGGLAGCASNNDGPQGTAPALMPLTEADIAVPAGATLTKITGGFAAVWENAALPFGTDVTVPPHATMIRAVGFDGATSASMFNTETSRRRCNNPTVESFSDGFRSPVSCSSATALDGPGAVWHFNIGGAGAAKVHVEFLDAPLDGLLAQLDLSLIDPPTQSLQDTVVEFIPSHDGILLRTERTLPDGDGPFPAIIVSSPYYTHTQGDPPADWAYVVHDWAQRGYAMVTADVRGFADSGGCVEVWGPNEQLDQKVLVEWVAAQPWSDGNVGFYGQSYVGTTPVEAAVQAPEALKAIVTIAPVINSYEDWHYGGVPNGENELSPLAYQVLTESTVTEVPAEIQEGSFLNDPQQLANNAANGPCDPTLVTRSNDPRAIVTPFYVERNFKLRAKDITAAVLYTEGFEDANVKAAMIPGWFNEIQAPKLGLFGHWLHQHPSRLDCEPLFVAWFEQYLKGKPIGLEALPNIAVQVDRETQRHAEEWPPTVANVTALWPDLNSDTMSTAPADGDILLYFDPTGSAGAGQSPQVPFTATYRMTLDEDLSLAGSATLHIRGAFQGMGTAYVMAELYEDGHLRTWGQLNLAHNEDHTQYTPILVGEVLERDLPFRPTENILRAGSEVTLVLRGVAVPEAVDPGGVAGAAFTFFGGPDGTHLALPGVPLADYEPISLTARP